MLSRLFGLYGGKPQNPVGADGRMALADHFRELRARLLRAITVLIVAIIVALVFYPTLYEFVLRPYNEAKKVLDPDVKSQITVPGVGGALMIQLKLCSLVALIGTAPYWLYQIWGFIMPGLHPAERKWTRVFVAIAGPLFVAGVALGYYVMPKGIEVLINFTPADATNLVDFSEFVSFMMRMLLVFGLAFEIPLFVVMLNLVGVLPGRVLARYRPWIVLGTFVFAAVATPSTDPFSMCFLAAPMLVLFGISEVITRAIDRARARREAQGILPDEASPL